MLILRYFYVNLCIKHKLNKKNIIFLIYANFMLIYVKNI
jgi:hypothetical protein